MSLSCRMSRCGRERLHSGFEVRRSGGFFFVDLHANESGRVQREDTSDTHSQRAETLMGDASPSKDNARLQ